MTESFSPIIVFCDPTMTRITIINANAQITKGEYPMSYYEPKDLTRFGEIGKFNSDLAEKFFDYYNLVTGQDGALTKREKALIALAIAHSDKCPYCIDAYTTACLESGANPEQMTEAVHVAAVMKAGITLVHGVQMHNALEKLGAM